MRSVSCGSRGVVGDDFDFINKYAVSSDHFFKLMGKGHELLPFLEWRQRVLDYAAAHTESPLARIAAVIDDLADKEATAGMLKGSPTRCTVFGGDVYPAPLVDEQVSRKYRDRIDFFTATTTTNGAHESG